MGTAASRRRPARHRRAATLLELVVVLAIAGLLLGIAVPPLRAWMDRIAVRGAADDLAALFAAARVEAVLRGGAGVEIDTVAGRAAVRSAGAVVLSRAPVLAGVRLAATRTAMSYDARGLGVGAANLRLVLRRGAAAETLLVSRLGRVRR